MRVWTMLLVLMVLFVGSMPVNAQGQEGPPYDPSQPIVTPTPRPYNTPHLGRFEVQFANDGWYRDPQLPAIVARVIEQAKLGTWAGGVDPYLPLGKGVGPGKQGAALGINSSLIAFSQGVVPIVAGFATGNEWIAWPFTISGAALTALEEI